MTIKPDKCLCAFCKLERRVYRKKHISSTNILLALVASLLLMTVFWQGPDPRVMLIFVVFLLVAEMFIQVRWRLTLSCPFCGFDPALYLRDPQLAAKKVKLRLEEAKDSPIMLSAHNPWTHLGPLIKKQAKSQRDKLHRKDPVLVNRLKDSTSGLQSEQI